MVCALKHDSTMSRSWLQMNPATKESLCLEAVTLQPPLTPRLQSLFLLPPGEKSLLTHVQSPAMFSHMNAVAQTGSECVQSSGFLALD